MSSDIGQRPNERPSKVIYQPEQIINLRREIEGGIVSAGIAAAADFLAGNNKPWTYYLGIGLGRMAVATGIPGAAATMYVVGDVVDAVLFKSPDGSDVRFFLNGVQSASFDTYAATAIWEAVQINLGGGGPHRLDILNFGPSTKPGATGVAWLGIGPITVSGTGAFAQPNGGFNMDVVAFRIKDAEADANLATLPIAVPSGLTIPQLQAWVDAVAPEIDELTEGTLEEVSVTISLTLPGGLKASPSTGALNERGGLISFNTTGPRRESVRIPAMSRTIMPGDSFSLSDTDVAALITRLTTATTAANIRPVTPNNYQYATAVKAEK